MIENEKLRDLVLNWTNDRKCDGDYTLKVRSLLASSIIRSDNVNLDEIKDVSEALELEFTNRKMDLKLSNLGNVKLFRGVQDELAQNIKYSFIKNQDYTMRSGMIASYATQKSAAISFAQKGYLGGLVYSIDVSLDEIVWISRKGDCAHLFEHEVVVLHKNNTKLIGPNSLVEYYNARARTKPLTKDEKLKLEFLKVRNSSLLGSDCMA